MTKGFAAIFASVSAIAIAVPAAAQDGSDYNGPRAEVLAGYDTMRPGSSTDIDNADDLDQSIDGITYGVGLGYDFQLGNVVLGVEGELMQSEAATDFDTTGFSDLGVGNVESNLDLYVGGRAGFLAGPRTLLYAKGGYTNASLDVLATDNVSDALTDVDLDGWRVGAGVEQSLGGGLFVKGEYRYSNYEEGEVEAPSGMESDRFDVDLDRHQVVVGFGARF